MRRWLILSVGIVVLMVVALFFVVRALIPPPIPDKPAVSGGPVEVHFNEIDLGISSGILLSIDNISSEPIIVDLDALGPAIAKGLRLFDPIGNEWTWINLDGGPVRAVLSASPWSSGFGWGSQARLRIEPGRSETVTLGVTAGLNLAAINRFARLRAQPDRLVYVLDCEFPLLDEATGARRAVRTGAKGEATYQARK